MGTIFRFPTAPTIPHILFLSFLRALPACDSSLSAARDGQFSGGCVQGNCRACTDGRAPAYFYRCNQLRVRADEGVVLDDGAMFVCAIVVAGDGARTDVHPAAHGAVADIAQVISLAPFAYLAILDLYKISDMRIVVQFRPGTQPCVWADVAVGTYLTIVDVTEWRNLGSLSNGCITNDTVSANSHEVSQVYLAFEDATDVDLDIAPANEFASHIDTSRIRQRHALGHHLGRNILLPDALQSGELYFVVDTLDFPTMRRLHSMY